jgi:hypothetical protein
LTISKIYAIIRSEKGDVKMYYGIYQLGDQNVMPVKFKSFSGLMEWSSRQFKDSFHKISTKEEVEKIFGKNPFGDQPITF